MGYVLTPSVAPRREMRRVADERLSDAIDRLSAVATGNGDAIDVAIHDVRKRCKEARGLARLVRPGLGDDFGDFDTLVRDAARQLSQLRDAHALATTLDTLAAAQPVTADDRLLSLRDRQIDLANAATASIEPGDARIERALNLLIDARHRSSKWKVPKGSDVIERGLSDTYRNGRRRLKRARSRPTDHRLHEWRKAVKYLWYQLRLLRDASPSVIGPMVEHLDDLADALGDDHDLAVLVARVDSEPRSFGAARSVDHVRGLAREQQRELRRRAFRSGATIYAEPQRAFAERMTTYWRIAVAEGPERAVGGIAALAPHPALDPPSAIERERKFLVDRLPASLDLSDRVELRQGYVAIVDAVSTRVRDAGDEGCTLTVKAGTGAERVEIERSIESAEFDAIWPFTDGRRVEKVRHRIPTGGLVIELDVFGGDLDGLVLAEVEFDSSSALDSFEPPEWFGIEVTDDGRFSNAALAIDGLPAGESEMIG